MPLVFCAESDCGRPVKTDWLGVTGLDALSLAHIVKLSGPVCASASLSATRCRKLASRGR